MEKLKYGAIEEIDGIKAYISKQFNITLFNADCVKIMENYKGEKINLMLADPPYGLLEKHKIEKHKIDWAIFCKQTKKMLAKNSMAILFGNIKNKETFKYFTEFYNGFGGLYAEVIWDKLKISSPAGNYKKAHESVYIFKKNNGCFNDLKDPFFERIVLNFDRLELATLNSYFNSIAGLLNNYKRLKQYLDFLANANKHKILINRKHHMPLNTASLKGFLHEIQTVQRGFSLQTIFRCKPHNLQGFNKKEYQVDHPTVKPIQILDKFIKIHSNNNDLVFDPFLGSGSTAIACIRNNRRFLGCEIDSEYFNLSIERIEREIENSENLVNVEEQPDFFDFLDNL